MRRIYIPRQEPQFHVKKEVVIAAISFLLGCLLTASVALHVKVNAVEPNQHIVAPPLPQNQQKVLGVKRYARQEQELPPLPNEKATSRDKTSVGDALQGIRVLVVIVAFDFSQIPHLEEVVDGYHDICTAGAAKVDVVIHTTVPWPVTLIDLWNTRFNCENFAVQIAIQPKVLRLHLVDLHRETFYNSIDAYDLFIYTEDDIRVRPTTVAAYLTETDIVRQRVAGSTDYKFSDFNVGIVRYEYNYPANVIMDDNTRHATQNVTRVYWEHSGFERPVVPNAIETLSQDPLANEYVTMKNHHQGMYLATRDLLLAWKERCHFDIASNRPGKGPQPTEGTQRVWMSSQMLYGGRHCNVQQVLPKDRFPTLTVLHLPNKNYRRVGKYRKRKFADGSEVFEQPHSALLLAMEVHVALRQALPNAPQQPYKGVTMIDEVLRERDRPPLLEARMREYQEYVKRGGVMSEEDMGKTDLIPVDH